jgi:replicative DNA helicase
VGGLSYLVSLDERHAQAVRSRTLRDDRPRHSLRRRLILTSQALIDRAVGGQESADEILASAETDLLQLGESHVANKLLHARDILSKAEGGVNAFLDPTKRIRGTAAGF